jgi:Gpi18-like mannosyltransferase
MEVVTLLKARKIGFNACTLKYCSFGLLFLLAIALRLLLYKEINTDYTNYISPWYDYIKSNGGFAALKDNFYNYNPPYLYLIALTTYLPIPKLLALKGISMLFDFVLAFFAYLIVSLKYRRTTAAVTAALVILLTPTIVLNSAVWGQCDAIYTAFCLGSLFFLLKDRGGWACVFFALAISFKLQAIFFLPVLIIVLIKRKTSLRALITYFILILALCFVLLIPTLAAGRSLASILSVYPQQVTTGGMIPDDTGASNVSGGQNGQSSQAEEKLVLTYLSYNAPNMYEWVAPTSSPYWFYLGIVLAGLVVLLVGSMTWVSKVALTPSIIIHITLVLVLAIPFFLPRMHERYFYLADVVSIIYAFYVPRTYYLAVIIQMCSFCCYVPFLYHFGIFKLGLLALLELFAVIIVLASLIVTLFPAISDKLKGRRLTCA